MCVILPQELNDHELLLDWRFYLKMAARAEAAGESDSAAFWREKAERIEKEAAVRGLLHTLVP